MSHRRRQRRARPQQVGRELHSKSARERARTALAQTARDAGWKLLLFALLAVTATSVVVAARHRRARDGAHMNMPAGAPMQMH